MMYEFNSRYNPQYSSVDYSSDQLVFPPDRNVIQGEEIASFTEEESRGYDSGIKSFPDSEETSRNKPFESGDNGKDLISFRKANVTQAQHSGRAEISSVERSEKDTIINTGTQTDKGTGGNFEDRKLTDIRSRSSGSYSQTNLENMEFYEPKETAKEMGKLREVTVPEIGMIPGRRSHAENMAEKSADVWSEDGQLLSGPSFKSELAGNRDQSDRDQEPFNKSTSSPTSPGDPNLTSFRHHVHGDFGHSNMSFQFPVGKAALNPDSEKVLTERQLFKSLTSSIVNEEENKEGPKEEPRSDGRNGKDKTPSTETVKGIGFL